jgi:hypothetical protein
MKFFVPQIKPHEAETAYASMRDVVKDQLRWSITERRIFGLKYTHDKKPVSIAVGELDGQSNRYTILAIFESGLYIAYAKAPNGAGVTMLINKDEVTEVEEFATA